MQFVKCIICISAFSFAYVAEAEQDIDKLAQDFANPNTPLTSLKFKFQYREFEGDLDNANNQSSTKVLVQPTLPFTLDNNYKLWVRPGINLVLDTPSYDASSQSFEAHEGIGDSSLDIQYGTITESGFLWSVGGSSIIPTASEDELGLDTWTLGPGFQLGQVTKSTIVGAFVNRQWDVESDNNTDYDVTTLQVFGVYLPGGGIDYAFSPIMDYNHETEDWTIPLNFTMGKTTVINSRPWKFSVGFNYYVEKPDDFGPDFMIEFTVAPVVVNKFAEWFL
ncbi:MAG: hypothetical protein V7696_19690 [Halioglobus sp.]